MMYYDRGKMVGRALLFFLYDVEGGDIMVLYFEVWSTKYEFEYDYHFSNIF